MALDTQVAPKAAPEFLVERRGVQRALGAYVVAARFDPTGQRAAFALGDGTLRLIRPQGPEEWAEIAVHDGAVLTLAPDCRAGGFLTGGDDATLRRIGADGTVATLASHGMRWVEQVASFPGSGKGKADGLIAASIGKRVQVFDEAGTLLKTLEHPSTVTGLAFDARGKRVIASHYNGASLWFVAAKTDSPRKLEWKGSHTGLAVHPEGDAVVTAMQENALHGWRLSDGQHMRMSGYPSKTRSLSFSRGGKWLASSGADAIVLWPFFGGGPMGKAPTELAGGDGVLCTEVACHPQQEMVAGGFADGLVVLADIASSRILPVVPPNGVAISTLAWSPDGTRLAIGGEQGFAALVDFTKQ
ncbi:MAG: WD40 repeat domain-containing protein [Rhodospirillales bacterium]|nr:WD40 repeat domain-containing protein [Rhodospirillales bacterium]